MPCALPLQPISETRSLKPLDQTIFVIPSRAFRLHWPRSRARPGPLWNNLTTDHILRRIDRLPDLDELRDALGSHDSLRRPRPDRIRTVARRQDIANFRSSA